MFLQKIRQRYHLKRGSNNFHYIILNRVSHIYPQEQLLSIKRELAGVLTVNENNQSIQPTTSNEFTITRNDISSERTHRNNILGTIEHTNVVINISVNNRQLI